jgi:fructose-specific phosphotransferase system IIA component
MLMTQIFHPGCVKVPLESTEKEAAITELIDLLNVHGFFSNHQEVLDTVIARERSQSTGTGAGIAIPHGKCSAVKELVMAIGIAQEPIEFDSIDGKPVKIIILLVSPANKSGEHIQALAAISRLLLQEDFRSRLENASSADEVYQLFNSTETRNT